MKRIEIFRPGAFKPMAGAEALSFSEGQLRATAVSYDPSKSEAPVVVGHPATDAPAFGWVKALDFADGTLGAYVDDLVPAFVDQVKAGRFKRVSASFYAPEATSNPRPGVYYLKHVGFLGAAAPAVPGLKSVSFAADVASFSFEGDFAGEDDGALSFADMRTRLAEHEAREIASFLDGLVKEARLPQGLRPLASALLQGAPAGAVVSFSEGGAEQRVKLGSGLRRLLQALPPKVEFGEFAKPEPGEAQGGTEISFPDGFEVPPERAAIAETLLRVSREKGITVLEAARMVDAERRGRA
jgi:hypothetical protein